MEQLSDLDIGYAAGIVDGEGHITLHRHSHPTLRPRVLIAVDSTDRSILDWLTDRFGGSVVKKKKYKDHHSQAYTWRLQDKRARSLIKIIEPYLLVRKKKIRARMVIDEWDQVTTQGTANYTPELDAANRDFVKRFLAVA